MSPSTCQMSPRFFDSTSFHLFFIVNQRPQVEKDTSSSLSRETSISYLCALLLRLRYSLIFVTNYSAIKRLSSNWKTTLRLWPVLGKTNGLSTVTSESTRESKRRERRKRKKKPTKKKQEKKKKRPTTKIRKETSR